MHRRISIVSAVSLCLLVAAAAQAQPTKENVGAAAADAQLNINWEATAQLVLVPLTAAQLDAGAHEAQVRIHEKSQPLFFERVTFDVPSKAAGLQARATPAPLGLQILAHHREERAWLLERLTEGVDLGVEIRIGDFVLYDGSFGDLVAQSDKFREGPIRPVEGAIKVADLRERPPLKLCVDDCYDDYAECQVDFCYWDYDEYMCNEGCDMELDACLAVADPVCPTPTCTPGVITTDTDTVLIGSQYVGWACMRDIFFPNGSVYYQLVNLTYQVTTRELRRNADCSTQWVTVGTSTTTTSCQQRTGISCSF
ncbi:MAG: hypothetical protein AAGF23_23180, partial [Acidobacteriota bacterium]